jgi:hypothetical protein
MVANLKWKEVREGRGPYSEMWVIVEAFLCVVFLQVPITSLKTTN